MITGISFNVSVSITSSTSSDESELGGEAVAFDVIAVIESFRRFLFLLLEDLDQLELTLDTLSLSSNKIPRICFI